MVKGQCIDDHSGESCAGDVDFRWPGYGDKLWPRCEKHGAERLEREEVNVARYAPDGPGLAVDPLDAGETWEDVA